MASSVTAPPMTTPPSTGDRDALTPSGDAPLPFAGRGDEAMPGHWLLASLGKKVLRPGGRALTDQMLAGLHIEGRDVLELAPGLGFTAQLLLGRDPSSYIGVDEDADASQLSANVVGARGRVRSGDAKDTGLPDASVDVAVNEAMLTMNTDRSKRQILAEVFRVLRPGGEYAFHELSLLPDNIAPAVATEVAKDLARTIKVNARPLTVAEWVALLRGAGFEIISVHTADMGLLRFRQLLADEGISGLATITSNYLRRPGARKRINAMWLTFQKYRRLMGSVAVVARKPVVARAAAGGASGAAAGAASGATAALAESAATRSASSADSASAAAGAASGAASAAAGGAL